MGLVLVLLVGCSGGSPPSECVTGRYSPLGIPVDADHPCDRDGNMCPLDCDDPEVCAGDPGVTYCEPCDQIAAYWNESCLDCQVGLLEGAIQLSCAEHL